MYSSADSATSALERVVGQRDAPMTAPPLYPRERKPVPILQEAGWSPGPVKEVKYGNKYRIQIIS